MKLFFLGIVYAVFSGLATMYAWNTLAVEIFDLFVIGFWEALGINVLFGWLTQRYQGTMDKSMDEKVVYFLGMFLRPAIVIIFVFIIGMKM